MREFWQTKSGKYSIQIKNTYSGGPIGDFRVSAMRAARSNVRRDIGRITMQLLHHLPHQRRPVEETEASKIESRLHLRTAIQYVDAVGNECQIQGAADERIRFMSRAQT